MVIGKQLQMRGAAQSINQSIFITPEGSTCRGEGGVCPLIFVICFAAALVQI